MAALVNGWWTEVWYANYSVSGWQRGLYANDARIMMVILMSFLYLMTASKWRVLVCGALYVV